MESRQNVPAGMEIKIKMKIVETIAEVRAQVKEWRAQGLSVGLVPTMGYLHEGHKSLIDRAVAENDKVVVSVFVNPMQFGVGEDLESYPRDMERDSALCENAGADFPPTAGRNVPQGFLLFCGYEYADERSLWKNTSDSFPRRVYGCIKIIQHCTAG